MLPWVSTCQLLLLVNTQPKDESCCASVAACGFNNVVIFSDLKIVKVTALAFSLLANVNQKRGTDIWLMSSSVSSHQWRFDSWIMPKTRHEKLLQKAGIVSRVNIWILMYVCVTVCVWPVLFKPRCVNQPRVAVVKLVFTAPEPEGWRIHTHTHTHTQKLVFRDHVLKGCYCPNMGRTLSVHQSDHTDH